MAISRALLLLIVTLSTPIAAADSIRILSQNVNHLFDNINDGHKEKILSTRRFDRRIDTVAKKIGSEFELPEIIALQEIENINVLDHIAAQIWYRYRMPYQMVLIPGQDISGINTAYLIHPKLKINKAEQLFRDKILNFSGNPLFTRPPLYIEVCADQQCLSLINLHLRSMRGIDSAKHGRRVIAKRLQQAKTIASWVNQYQRVNPDAALMLLGDFNALTPADEYIDVIGIIRGDSDHSTDLGAKDLVEPDLIDLTRNIAKARRYSYVFRKNKQQLDYMMVNQAFPEEMISIEFSRIDRRFSDHAGLIASFKWPHESQLIGKFSSATRNNYCKEWACERYCDDCISIRRLIVLPYSNRSLSPE